VDCSACTESLSKKGQHKCKDKVDCGILKVEFGKKFSDNIKIEAASVDGEEGDVEAGEVMYFHAHNSRGDECIDKEAS